MSTENEVIGSAKLSYDIDGNIAAAQFQPAVDLVRGEFLKELGTCNGKGIDAIKECAQLLLAAFFKKISDIELRDIEKTDIETRVVDVSHYTSTAEIKTIELEFIYKQK